MRLREAARRSAYPAAAARAQFPGRLPQLPDADTIADRLKPLLQRVAEVTRWRRAAIVAGCLALPLFGCFCFIFGMTMLKQQNRSNPGRDGT